MRERENLNVIKIKQHLSKVQGSLVVLLTAIIFCTTQHSDAVQLLHHSQKEW